MVEDDGKPKDETVPEGKEDDKVDEKDKPVTTPLIDIANLAAERMEKANKETARLFKLQEDRDARMALGGTTGGREELVLITEAELKSKKAQEFFKDTALGDAIKKTNE